MKLRCTYDCNLIHAAIKTNSRAFYEMMLGTPNRKLSNHNQLRYGTRGSLVVALTGKNAGMWFDHEAQQGGDGLDLIMRECGVRFLEACKIAEQWVGNSGKKPAPPRGLCHERQLARPPQTTPKSATCDHTNDALKIWEQSVPIVGTASESYLNGRAIDATGLDHVLRFHKNCPRGNSTSAAMVAQFRDIHTDKACAIHRIYIAPDGQKAHFDDSASKMMLGPTKTAAIKISPDHEVEQGLGITEGIEDALSILQAGWAPIWAVGSAGKITNFPPLQGVDCITIFADADEAGLNAATACAENWRAAGKEGVIWTPPPPFGDWNEAAKSGAVL
jgi:putative DNA primase/helicase